MTITAEALPPVLDRMLAFWNGEDLDPAVIYVEGCVENGESTFGPADVIPEVQTLRSGLPDLRFAVDDWFQAGNRYILRMHAEATHDGELATPLGFAKPTGRKVSLHGIEVFEVADDRIVGVWVGWNYGELYAALGATLPGDE